MEDALIERLVARDERAFNELLRVYGRRVYGLVYRMLGNHAEAEEVTQDVFIQVFKAIDSFRGDAKLSTWLYRIAVNLCKNRMKYLKVRKAGQQDDIDGIADRVSSGEAARANVGTVERPDEALAGRQIEEIVRQAMLAIDPVYRECLILCDVEELSYEEIMSVTGLPLGTVKSRIFRARTQLKALVERAMGETLR